MIALVIWAQASISIRTYTHAHTSHLCTECPFLFFVQSTANAMVWFDWRRVLIDEIMETGYILDTRVMQIYWHLLTIGKKKEFQIKVIRSKTAPMIFPFSIHLYH